MCQQIIEKKFLKSQQQKQEKIFIKIKIAKLLSSKISFRKAETLQAISPQKTLTTSTAAATSTSTSLSLLTLNNTAADSIQKKIINYIKHKLKSLQQLQQEKQFINIIHNSEYINNNMNTTTNNNNSKTTDSLLTYLFNESEFFAVEKFQFFVKNQKTTISTQHHVVFDKLHSTVAASTALSSLFMTPLFLMLILNNFIIINCIYFYFTCYRHRKSFRRKCECLPNIQPAYNPLLQSCSITSC